MRKEDTFRAFFAVDLAEDVKEKVWKLIERLKGRVDCRGIRWTKKEHLHITVRFLGNISKEQYERIICEVMANLGDLKPFYIRFTDVVLFPSLHNPRVLSLKPEPFTPLIKLSQVLESCVVKHKILPEHRAFVPHLTLGKIRHGCYPRLNGPKLINVKNRVTSLTLFKSEPTSEGSAYEALVCLLLG